MLKLFLEVIFWGAIFCGPFFVRRIHSCENVLDLLRTLFLEEICLVEGEGIFSPAGLPHNINLGNQMFMG